MGTSLVSEQFLLDRSFAPVFNSPFGNIGTVIPLSNGKILVQGNFQVVNNELTGNLVRFNSDGSLDSTFIGKPTFTYSPLIIPGPDGTIYYSSYDIVSRLSEDGMQDPAFFPVRLNFINLRPQVRCLAVQSDGMVLIGGEFFPIAWKGYTGLDRVDAFGIVDQSFNQNRGFSGSVDSMVVQRDGGVVIAGSFFAGAGRGGGWDVRRLLSDGSLDTNFVAAITNVSYVDSIIQQSDGKLLVAGSLGTVRDSNLRAAVRLFSDGSEDSTFDFTNAFWIIGAIISGDGTIIGRGGIAPQRVVQRFKPDGSPDATFKPETNLVNSCSSLGVQSDGRILVGNASPTDPANQGAGVIRLNRDGTRDNTFKASLLSVGSVTQVLPRTDGSYIVLGNFSMVNGVRRSRIARILPDSTLDEAFLPNLDFPEGTLFPQAAWLLRNDGFLLRGAIGNNLNVLVEYERNGNVNANFNTAFRTRSLVDGSIYGITEDPVGNLILFGAFSLFDGIVRHGIARVSVFGNLDPTFNCPNREYPVPFAALLSDKRIMLWGNLLERLEPNGPKDTNFSHPIIDGNMYAGGVSRSPLGGLLFSGEFRTSRDQANGDSFLALDSSGNVTNVFSFTFDSSSRNRMAAFLPSGKFVASEGRRLYLLDLNGDADSSFVPLREFGDWISNVAVGQDGALIIGGAFSVVNGSRQFGMARFLPVAGDKPFLRLLSVSGDSVARVLIGGATGTTIELQVSKDLKSWTSVTNVSSADDLQPITVSNSTGASPWFYRAASKP